MVLLVGYSLLRLKSDDTGVPMFRPHQVVGKYQYECFSQFIYTHAQSKTVSAQCFLSIIFLYLLARLASMAALATLWLAAFRSRAAALVEAYRSTAFCCPSRDPCSTPIIATSARSIKVLALGGSSNRNCQSCRFNGKFCQAARRFGMLFSPILAAASSAVSSSPAFAAAISVSRTDPSLS